MKTPKLLLVTLLTSIVYCYADPASEALIAVAKAKGQVVYSACIVTPPIEPDQIAFCTTAYAIYLSSLQAVNAPLPIAPALTPSPYAWSPYDLCRFETSHFVFNAPGQPYCPAV